MLIFISLVIATTFLAYANGANDNFKGVATLFGSDTANYKKALRWATVTTFLGGVASIFLAETLIRRFSGKGLVPDVLAGSPEFLLAVALGAGLTVILATLLGFPISTTHSLTGALVGAGMMAVGKAVNFSVLGGNFFLPLLLSPFIAAALAGIYYATAQFLKTRLNLNEKTSFHLSRSQTAAHTYEEPLVYRNTMSVADSDTLVLVEKKEISYRLQTLLDHAHYLSAGMVSFARGLNDTPKIVALLLAFEALGIEYAMLIVAIAMAIGGLLNARKVALTMSRKITAMSPLQGFTANIATGLLVIFASRMGMPVSTTHVSVGALFGIGILTRKINGRMSLEILLSWVLTLPVAALLSAAAYAWII